MSDNSSDKSSSPALLKQMHEITHVIFVFIFLVASFWIRLEVRLIAFLYILLQHYIFCYIKVYICYINLYICYFSDVSATSHYLFIHIVVVASSQVLLSACFVHFVMKIYTCCYLGTSQSLFEALTQAKFIQFVTNSTSPLRLSFDSASAR